MCSSFLRTQGIFLEFSREENGKVSAFKRQVPIHDGMEPGPISAAPPRHDAGNKLIGHAEQWRWHCPLPHCVRAVYLLVPLSAFILRNFMFGRILFFEYNTFIAIFNSDHFILLQRNSNKKIQLIQILSIKPFIASYHHLHSPT